MITVHHLNNSRSQRVLWLLEELGRPYEIRHYQRDAVTMLAPPELKAVHPLGKSPVITHGDETIAETGAIFEHLLDTEDDWRLIPRPGTPERTRFRYWMHFAEGSAMPPLVMTLLLNEMPKRLPEDLRPAAAALGQAMTQGYLGPTMGKQLDLMEAELTRSTHFVGDTFTAADIMMSFPLEAASSRVGLAAYPKLTAWLAAMHARPAYQTALTKGGPYAYA